MPDSDIVSANLSLDLLKVEMAPRVNLGFFHNSVSAVSSIRIQNDTDTRWENVVLSMRCAPAFFREKTWRIDAIPARSSHYIEKPVLDFDSVQMERLTETEKVQLVWTVFMGETPLTELVHSLDCLARNHWCGTSYAPELLAAHVRPNDPVVDSILHKTAELLRQNNRNAAIAGYDDSPKRAWEIASGIWTALAGWALEYSALPAGFENSGQKIREPGQIAEHKMANCMDATVLICSALEQAGLDPLIVVTKGHAFAGVWLRPSSLSAPVLDDVATLRNLLRLEHIILFETTYLTNRPIPDFMSAIRKGAAQIGEGLETEFSLLLDIRQARVRRILPMGSEMTRAEVKSARDVVDSGPGFVSAPEMLGAADDSTPVAPKTPEGRVAHWRRMLLDLSGRNALLNFNYSGKKAIRLAVSDSGQLEDLLAEGKQIRLQPSGEMMTGADPRDAVVYRVKTGGDAAKEHARLALAKGQVHALSLVNPEFESRMTDLYRQARSDMQEGGANTLYLAFGFLSWSKPNDADRKFRAPLVLVPVSLERKGVGGGFHLSAHEDDTRFNSTLMEMLRQNFELELPYLNRPLPTDVHGVDVERVKREVADSVLGRPGWEVLDDVVLSTFSFSKYLMWKDLTDRMDLLKESPVVRHLIDCPGEPFPSRVDFPSGRDLDRDWAPEKILCPLPADSSQVSAIVAANSGKDFVIIGPPGTGKSQTITNMIANALADGKRVLFVAEKIAALEVVHRRLASLGLGDFCMELHSGKARKSEVIKKLKEVWDSAHTRPSTAWMETANQLHLQRKKLNGFVEVLHRTRRHGWSAFDAMGLVVAGRGVTQEIEFHWGDVDEHDVPAYQELTHSVERLAGTHSQLDSSWPHPLSFVTHSEWSPLWQRQFVQAARALPPLLDEQEAATSSFSGASGVSKAALESAPFPAICAWIQLMPESYGKSLTYLLKPEASSVIRRLESATGLLNQYRECSGSLAEPWSEKTCQTVRHGMDLVIRYRNLRGTLTVPYREKEPDAVDFSAKLEEWRIAQQSWLSRFPVFSRSAKIKAELRALCVDSESKPTLPGDLETLAELQALRSEMDTLAADLSEAGDLWKGYRSDIAVLNAALAHRNSVVAALAHTDEEMPQLCSNLLQKGTCGATRCVEHETVRKLSRLRKELSDYAELGTATEGLWRGLDTDLEEVRFVASLYPRLTSVLASLATDAGGLKIWREATCALFGSDNPMLIPGGVFLTTSARFITAVSERMRAQSAWASNGAASLAEADSATVRVAVAACVAFENKLHDWCPWVAARDIATKHGLGALIPLFSEKPISDKELNQIFEYNYARWWLTLLVDAEPVLRDFRSESQEKSIQKFRELDDTFMRLTRDYIRARLCSKVPPSPATPTKLGKIDHNEMQPQWGYLSREMVKKTQHRPIREWFEKCPGAISVLAPCLLMSPLSIAQYLSAGVAPFDMVVFDEASQIPTWDAIGAMARGRHVIMVGDPKQLPPTNFFQSAAAPTDGDGQADGIPPNMESVLDECIGAGLPQWPLTWHYRSKNESLITFSNRQYYGGKLITFPSPDAKDCAVSLAYVPNGVYERGLTRTNPIEASALVDEIISRLRDSEFRRRRLSIGVVTFNAQQQELIEDLLDAGRAEYPEIEEYFRERDEHGDEREYLFVKNLESVQGDERDIIYFSTTFGPDASGVIHKHFGPLNLEGGHRRLNVAVTRSRHEMRVFSTMKAEQLDLNSGQKQGAQDLKLFLDFAERGVSVLAAPPRGSVGGYDSPFEEAVANMLRLKGWDVRTQIGVSAFRIDLAVIDPARPGRFLTGIECDGATYHSSATARDRDKLREQVLRDLGWEILRVWSTDWWYDSAKCIAKLDAKLRELAERLPLSD